MPPIAEEDDPWVQYAGLWADDPDWDVFQSEVEAFRQAKEVTSIPDKWGD
jgi:hypothetical protein